MPLSCSWNAKHCRWHSGAISKIYSIKLWHFIKIGISSNSNTICSWHSGAATYIYSIDFGISWKLASPQNFPGENDHSQAGTSCGLSSPTKLIQNCPNMIRLTCPAGDRRGCAGWQKAAREAARWGWARGRAAGARDTRRGPAARWSCCFSGAWGFLEMWLLTAQVDWFCIAV